MRSTFENVVEQLPEINNKFEEKKRSAHYIPTQRATLTSKSASSTLQPMVHQNIDRTSPRKVIGDQTKIGTS